MTIGLRVALSGLLLLRLCVAYAAEEDASRSLEMKCDYAGYNAFEFESVSITQATTGQIPEAGTQVFSRSTTPQTQSATFGVKAGQFSECVFPSGRRVRVKVGEGTPRAYGMCGGDPEVFTSIWVDKRKVLSRLWFAGHCREDHDRSLLSLAVSAQKVTRCQKAAESAATGSSTPLRLNQSQGAPLEACVDFPDVGRFPVDSVEYPRPGTRVASVGSVEIVRGSDPVCTVVASSLRSDSLTSSSGANPSLVRPEQRAASVGLPVGLAGATESVFDFNNDGTLDRVFSRAFENTYMHGSVLLVQPGASPTKLQVGDSVLSPESLLLPCQLDDKKRSATDCPPFSQTGDDAAIMMNSGPNQASVHFVGRYAEVASFRFQDTTYIDIASHSEDTQHFVAVLKPLPDRRFQQMCLIRKVPENF